MVENGMNAVSIVDVEGKLDTHLSSASLRVLYIFHKLHNHKTVFFNFAFSFILIMIKKGLTAETFKSLRLPVEEFLKIQNFPIDRSCVCSGSNTFEEVIQQLVSFSTHRLWVEDGAHFPVGVVSLTDVFSIFKDK